MPDSTPTPDPTDHGLDNETIDRLVQVMLDGTVTGMQTVMIERMGVPIAAAATSATTAIRAIYRDPIARNILADRAVAIFTQDPARIAEQQRFRDIPLTCTDPNCQADHGQDGAGQ